jgi:hypothetical protein
MKIATIIASGALLAGGSFAASGCHLQPKDVCEYYQGEGRPGVVDIYHFHYKDFTFSGNTYFGGYHCRVARAGYPDITYCIGEKNGGDTDPLDTCDHIH